MGEAGDNGKILVLGLQNVPAPVHMASIRRLLSGMRLQSDPASASSNVPSEASASIQRCLDAVQSISATAHLSPASFSAARYSGPSRAAFRFMRLDMCALPGLDSATVTTFLETDMEETHSHSSSGRQA